MNPTQPTLPSLLARYLDRQTSAHDEGLGFAEAGEEVVPFDAVPVQPVEPRLAWNEALAVLRASTCRHGRAEQPRPGRTGRPWSPRTSRSWPCRSAWATSRRWCGTCPACCTAPGEAAVRAPSGSAPVRPEPGGVGGRRGSADGYPAALVAIAVLRLARQLDAAGRLLVRLKDVPAGWQPVVANEEAALAWNRGDLARAAALWRAQPASVPVLFNRGLAALFLGEPAAARTDLGQAAAQLPDDLAWHHLARLYLALAEMRG